ncbi:MAG TPA: zf-TFIIB domain-containing protein [Gemmatimonadales bacterium]|nr:zf-TFIIB domain-containing protein [Gemmatimonadales bacterium]
MSVDKPSRNENEYFVRREAELIKAAHEHEIAEREAAARHSHFMKCPKDGYDLTTQEFHGVDIETCPHCGGVWLDAEDVHTYAHHREPDVVSRVFAEFLANLHFTPTRAAGAPVKSSTRRR